MTRIFLARSRGITLFQLDPSGQASCTSVIVAADLTMKRLISDGMTAIVAPEDRMLLINSTKIWISARDDNHSQERRHMSTITTKDGVEIYYKDWGKGQPIVFSHGWPLSADDWDTQMLFFLKHGYRVIELRPKVGDGMKG
jgi:hypothetical protein